MSAVHRLCIAYASLYSEQCAARKKEEKKKTQVNTEHSIRIHTQHASYTQHNTHDLPLWTQKWVDGSWVSAC